MRLVYTHRLKSDMVLARPLVSEEGTLLLAEGVPLGESLIHRLVEVGVPFVYVRDDRFPTDRVQPLVSPQSLRRVTADLRGVLVQAAQDHASSSLTLSLEVLGSQVEELICEVLSQPDLVVHLLDLKSCQSYEVQHGVQTLVLSALCAHRLGVSREEIRILGLGALLHDLGKVFLSPGLMSKVEPLSEEEWKEIRRHPEMGAGLMEEHRDLWPLASEAALSHHERLDGSGYPDGKREEQVSATARIVAVADVYDALTSPRPYRPVPFSPLKALRHLQLGAGRLYDPRVVEAFSSLICPFPVGTWLRLSTGHVGLVTEIHPEAPDRPVLSVVRLEGKGPLPQPLRVDLAAHRDASVRAILEDEDSVVLHRLEDEVPDPFDPPR